MEKGKAEVHKGGGSAEADGGLCRGMFSKEGRMLWRSQGWMVSGMYVGGVVWNFEVAGEG